MQEHAAPILVAEDLHKSYGPRAALRGLSFSLLPGRILGFLGPNGAGKTTAIRILTTILQPDSGRYEVDGIGSEQPDQIRRRIGVLPEQSGFPRHVTGIEYLTFFGRLYGQGAAEARERAQVLLQEVGLGQRARSLISSYSHGMRQRIGIARALVNEPAVVFLDEPTLGLDPRGQQELLALVRGIASERAAGVILCSHLLTEVESVCDEVVILSAGQVIAQGSVSEVTGRSQLEPSALRIHVEPASVREAQQALEVIPVVSRVTPMGENEGWLRVEVLAPQDRVRRNSHPANNRILQALIRARVPILSFEPEGGRLQDIFLQLTEARR